MTDDLLEVAYAAHDAELRHQQQLQEQMDDDRMQKLQIIL